MPNDFTMEDVFFPEYDSDDWAEDPFNNGEIDDQGLWDFDPFGPDADVWDSLD